VVAELYVYFSNTSVNKLSAV